MTVDETAAQETMPASKEAWIKPGVVAFVHASDAQGNIATNDDGVGSVS